MRQIVKAILVFGLLLTSIDVFTQEKKLPELSVGDTIPDIEITGVINYKTDNIRISEFKNKLLILDFWATWCSPCIASFPKLDSLQKNFNNDIQILSVTSEDKSKVVDFLDRLNRVKKVLPPSVTNDLTLDKFFRHTSLPHYVWIEGSTRKVIAITEGKDLSAENIKSFIRTKQMHYTLKKDDRIKVIGSPVFMPALQVKRDNLIELKRLPDSNLIIHSALTRYTEGLNGGFKFGDSTYICVTNATIRRLYQIALLGNGLSLINSSSINTEINDLPLYNLINGLKSDGSELGSGLETTAWKRENAYCYELKLPKALARQRFKIMLDELNKYFGAIYNIEGIVETRNKKYLALIETSNEIQFNSNGGASSLQQNKFYLKMQNMPINALVINLALPLQSYPPVVNETGIKERVDIELNCQLSDLYALNKELSRYGLRLEEKERLINTAVIRIKRN